ncbi:MAG: PD-(D/E)XK nuclease family protein [Bacteriovoracaceae bacterium]|jgi:hypothetical protein|nr:PD-(D/E)XK nuclease family protein [Bacteriovoracaceae bacterium]
MSAARKIDIEEFIHECFSENYTSLSSETGKSLSLKQQEAAIQQVVYYLYRMWDIAENVTETEVKLVLPGQRTRKNRKYNLLGVVDLVSDDSGTRMYDLKTLEKDVILEDKEKFRKQLSIYSHIWKGIKDQKLEGTAIIATSVPTEIKRVVKQFIEDPEAKFQEFHNAIEKVEPIISVDVNETQIQDFLTEFGDTIDKIEERVFTPANVIKLRTKQHATNSDFGSLVCRNCDARYSCDSYREYIGSARGKVRTLFGQYWDDDEETAESWIIDNLYED